MSCVSIITPTQLTRLPMLEKAYLSLINQEVPYEWIVVVDGNISKDFVNHSLAFCVNDPAVKILTLGKSVGAAAARNFGLSVATGDYITTLDDDDLLPDRSLSTRLNVLAHDESTGWVCGLLKDFNEAGTAHNVWRPPAPAGNHVPGSVFRCWEKGQDEFPLAPNALMVRRNYLLAVGGWMGLPQAEDFGMAIAVTSTYAGKIIDEVVYHYRKHENQMMKEHDFMLLEERVRHAVWVRGNALNDSEHSHEINDLVRV